MENKQLLRICIEEEGVKAIIHSSIQRLHHMSMDNATCYIKRDDLIGGLCNGSKFRKYLSLLPYLIEQQFSEVVVIGGAYSNNVSALVPMLIQQKIKPTLFLRGEPSTVLTGNFLHTRLFVDLQNIHWISRQQWPNVNQIVDDYVTTRLLDNNKIGVVPEGACMPQALWGSLSLALDIVANECEQELMFDHIFIEAGTGGTAAALIIGLAFLRHHAKIHVLLLAEDEDHFRKQVIKFTTIFNGKLPIELNSILQNIQCHVPKKTKAFGAVNATIFNNIIYYARTEGIILDPIYSAKLLIEGQCLINHHHLKGNIMFVHNGGTLGIMGYEHHLQKAIAAASLHTV